MKRLWGATGLLSFAGGGLVTVTSAGNVFYRFVPGL